MPITHHKGGTTITGDSIDYFRLCTLKAAVGLEMKGMKVRHGPVIWRQVKREFGIAGNKQAVYTWLCETVETLKHQQEHVIEDGGRRRREVGGVELS